MSCTRFEEISRFLFDQNHNQHILKFLEAVSSQFQSCLTPSLYVSLDECMIKLFQCYLKSKIKIILKPRPIGNEIKNLSDATTNIVFNMKSYKEKDIMAHEEHVKPFRATTATLIQLTQPYHSTEKIMIADSQFGSVKRVVGLLNKGLYSIMLVKTKHKNFPRGLLGQNTLKRGQWVAYTATVDDNKTKQNMGMLETCILLLQIPYHYILAKFIRRLVDMNLI